MNKLSRSDALRKCIVVFEAIRRMSGKGNAGLEPERGAEEQFDMANQVLENLREMLRAMEAGEDALRQAEEQLKANRDELAQIQEQMQRQWESLKGWQQERIMAGGPPERLDV